MKILVLSHTRSGSTVFCKWLSKELNIELDETQYHYKTFNTLFNKDKIIIKIVIEEYDPPNEIVEKFDKVICITRENSIESAISFVNADTKAEWHVTYKLTNEWIDSNKDKIIKRVYIFQHLKKHLKNKDLFQITYENIYINKVDIDRVLSYLHIEKPKHLDMLDYGKKYRTDTFTLNYDFKRKNII